MTQPGPRITVAPPLGRRSIGMSSFAHTSRFTSWCNRLDEPRTTAGTVACHVRTTGFVKLPISASFKSASSIASCSAAVISGGSADSSSQCALLSVIFVTIRHLLDGESIMLCIMVCSTFVTTFKKLLYSSTHTLSRFIIHGNVSKSTNQS